MRVFDLSCMLTLLGRFLMSHNLVAFRTFTHVAYKRQGKQKRLVFRSTITQPVLTAVPLHWKRTCYLLSSCRRLKLLLRPRHLPLFDTIKLFSENDTVNEDSLS